jgi:lysophospholipase L1-like esterase
MGSLVDEIFSLVPKTVVIVAKLPPNGNSATEANIETFNADLDSMALARLGKKLLVWNMHDSLSLTTDIGQDGLHPTDAGYQKLAGLFYDAVLTTGDWIYSRSAVKKQYSS